MSRLWWGGTLGFIHQAFPKGQQLVGGDWMKVFYAVVIAKWGQGLDIWWFRQRKMACKVSDSWRQLLMCYFPMQCDSCSYLKLVSRKSINEMFRSLEPGGDYGDIWSTNLFVAVSLYKRYARLGDRKNFVQEPYFHSSRFWSNFRLN